jgi:hypothetical protein
MLPQAQDAHGEQRGVRRRLPPIAAFPCASHLLDDVERRGHFAAFEEPELSVDELRRFKRAMRAL